MLIHMYLPIQMETIPFEPDMIAMLPRKHLHPQSSWPTSLSQTSPRLSLFVRARQTGLFDSQDERLYVVRRPPTMDKLIQSAPGIEFSLTSLGFDQSRPFGPMHAVCH